MLDDHLLWHKQALVRWIIPYTFFSNEPFPPLYKVLTSHSCSEEGLEDAANILLQLSRGDGSTRDTVLRLLLSGARHLGYTLCKQIGQCWATTQLQVITLFRQMSLYSTFLIFSLSQAHYWPNSENTTWSSRDGHRLTLTPRTALRRIPPSQPGSRARWLAG